ncbi:hypothetical protein [Thermoflexibacter ruber]|uniref:Uncharacterized protein n=1 Tax=Thermoflexibacter ruber TaxID=1003 RepID=A0A1I2IGS5_9BACT|nr:hypothetical protein [Thermoflexibacter ruber]SFF41592.1 hypothetical protein SAMN04488541_103237 [Thermoflexibacter ruber]
MKKLTILFSSALIFSLTHALCCILPYLIWGLGLMGLPFYMSFLLPLQPYWIVLQVIVMIYTIHRIRLRYKHHQRKTKIGIGVLVVLHILLLIFLHFQHAQAEKKNHFGKKIIQNIR